MPTMRITVSSSTSVKPRSSMTRRSASTFVRYCSPPENGRTFGHVAAHAPDNDEGRARGPALVKPEAVLRAGYQLPLLQPFVLPVQLRLYEPGEALDFVMVKTPVDFEVA